MLFSIDWSSVSDKVGNAVVKADAPQMAHSLDELSATWIWETTEGDAASDFAISIEQVSDIEINIRNFLNIDGECITAQVDGNSITFGGELAGGNLVIKNGKGTITNGWINIMLSYDTYDGEETEHHEVMLSRQQAL